MNVILGFTLAALAHPGLLSAAAPRLAHADIRVDCFGYFAFIKYDASNKASQLTARACFSINFFFQLNADRAPRR